MQRWLSPLMFLLLAVWAASQWGIGYLAVPVLFSELGDRQLAGQVAGVMFLRGGLISLACALGVAVFWWRLYGWRWRDWGPVLLVAASCCGVAVLFVIQPEMAELKAAVVPQDVMASPLRSRFIALHGLSSVLYLLESLAVAVLLVLLAARCRDLPQRAVET